MPDHSWPAAVLWDMDGTLVDTERVVWEVVPVLAETIIKEEIARLTK